MRLKKKRKPRRRRLKGKRGRGTAADDKPPVLGMIQRNGSVIIRMLNNVQRVTIEPIIRKFVKAGSIVYTESIQTNTIYIIGYQVLMFITPSIMVKANMPEMMMVMENTKSMLIRWKALGLC